MNITRSRLMQFVPAGFYKEYMTNEPVLYFAGEFVGNDNGIGVYDLCIARMPFYGAWAV
jgi:hypothetical protein